MTRCHIGLNAFVLEVVMTYSPSEGYQLKPKGTVGGFAFPDLWADIAPTNTGIEGDYEIVGVYLADNWHTGIIALEGDQRKEAIRILEGNDKWLEWARQEAIEMKKEM